MSTVPKLLNLVVSIAVVSLLSVLAPSNAGATVSGALTANGQKAPLILTYIDEGPEDIIVVLASKEVPSDAVPFIGEEVARKFKIHAVAFTVSRANKSLSAGFNGVFYPGPEMGYAAMAVDDATLQVKRFDAEGIEGRIFTPKAVASSDLTYSFDATFSIPLGKAAPAATPVTVKISGDVASPPTAAYAEYYKVVFSGDEQKIRSSLTAARMKEFDAMDADTRKAMLEIMKSNPPEIRLGKPVMAGNTATFPVEGLNLPTTKTSAEVTMIKEGDAWKVEKEKWSTTSK
jgi:hypothetical protein